jgi:hypothetical protein
VSTGLAFGWLLVGAGVLAVVSQVVREDGRRRSRWGPDAGGRWPTAAFAVLCGLIGGLALESDGAGIGAWIALGCLALLTVTFWWLPGA